MCHSEQMTDTGTPKPEDPEPLSTVAPGIGAPLSDHEMHALTCPACQVIDRADGVEDGQLQEAQVADVLRSCIDDLKLAIDSMEPVEADLLLLLATLRFRLGSRLKSSSISLVWNISDVPALHWLDPRNALHILRILQEAFANILKHAQASEIRVSTHAAGGWIEVTVADNGRGFRVDEALVCGFPAQHQAAGSRFTGSGWCR